VLGARAAAAANASAVAAAAASPAPIAASVAGSTFSWIGESAWAGSPKRFRYPLINQSARYA